MTTITNDFSGPSTSTSVVSFERVRVLSAMAARSSRQRSKNAPESGSVRGALRTRGHHSTRRRSGVLQRSQVRGAVTQQPGKMEVTRLSSLATPLPIGSYHHINREVIDVRASIRFYCQVLGLEEIARPKFPRRGAWMRGRGLNLHLTQALRKDVESRKALMLQRQRHFLARIPNVDHFAFLCERLDEVGAGGVGLYRVSMLHVKNV